MKPLVCTQCGAAIDPVRMVCRYCGTHYERNHEDTIKITYHPGPRPEVLQCIAEIPDSFVTIPSEEIKNCIHSQITRKIAESLEPFAEYQVAEDPVRRTHLVRGRVRVLPPGHEF